jgi:hypothetical protein
MWSQANSTTTLSTKYLITNLSSLQHHHLLCLKCFF